eukprot:Em0010g918a
MERTPRDAGRRRDGTQVDEPPQRRNTPSGNPRGLLRVPHFSRDARPPPEPPQPPSSDKTHPDRGEDWPSVTMDSGARDAGRKQLLWSAVVKTVPQQVLRTQSPPPPVPPASSGGEDEEEGEGGPDETQPKKKKRRKKKKSAEGTQSATVRRYTQPLVIELGTVLQEAAELRQAKMTVAAGAPAQALPKKSVPERVKDEKSIPRNALDSSAPLVRRGKERETPKKKKPSALKKVIAKEKEEKRKLREQGLSIPPDFDVSKQQPSGDSPGLGHSEAAETKAVDEGHSEAETKADAEGHSEAETKADAEGHSEAEKKAVAEGHSEAETEMKAFEAETRAVDEHERTYFCAEPKTIHNRKFRNYCDHLVTEEINKCMEQLVSELVRFQERQYQKDPIKARARKRYVCGLREVAKHVKLKKLKCVVIPPNLDNIQSTGGINSAVENIIGNCRELNIPVAYGLSRRKLAYLLKKKHKVGCLGIFSYDGAEVWYKQMMELVGKAREEYQLKVALLSVEQGPSTTLLSSPQLQAAVQDALETVDLSSGSESASQNEAEDGGEGVSHPHSTDILKSPWGIFFNQGTVAKEAGDSAKEAVAVAKEEGGGGSHRHVPSDARGGAVGHSSDGNTGNALNIAAAEFVPATPFKFNIYAENFVPITLDSNGTSKFIN